MPSNYRLYDNTRISDARRCFRYYFFRHVMHWKRAGQNENALAFGGAWHAAQDELWRGVSGREPRIDVVNGAYDAFVKHWTEAGMPHPSEIDLDVAKDLKPRTPMRAREMLEEYYDKRQRYIMSVEVLEVERAFAVPLDPEDDTLFYVGRIDKVVQPASNRIRAIEHKTTTAMRLGSNKSDYRISGNYMESYSPNSQVDGYSYALHMLYPGNRTDVWVDAALVHDKGEHFEFIPIEKTVDMLDSWMSDTHWWIARIEGEAQVMMQEGPDDKIMRAFPKNTNSCFDFHRACPFLDLCRSRPNPLSFKTVPPGYVFEMWDPLEHTGKPKELT